MAALRWRRHLTTLSFLAPVLIGITVFFLYPLISAVYFSFTKFDLLSVPEWVGLDNYRRMAGDPNLLQSVRNTLWMVAVFVPVRIVSAIGISMLLTQLKRGAGVFRTIFYLPALAPPVAATIAFVYLLKPGTGPVNTFLGQFGTRVSALTNQVPSLESVFLSLTGRELRDQAASARDRTAAFGRKGGEHTR